ncbi:hypothetical protein [Streptomyces sp. NPDC087300]|uniref:hypothetical protein n=1 Tax=Streptomyces sp. NPDC087300 TaxID=3365780 RepID=UPI003824651F
MITGSARLTIARFLYDWDHGDHCLLAYTSHGAMGVAATIPNAEGDAPDLWSMAGRNLPPSAQDEDRARWAICAGWALNTSTLPEHRLTLVGHEWTLEVIRTLHEIKPHQYGNSAYGWTGAHIGRLTLNDPYAQAQAHTLLVPAVRLLKDVTYEEFSRKPERPLRSDPR